MAAKARKELVYVFPEGVKQPSHRHVYVLSDGTATTCEAVLISGLCQFADVSVTVHKIPRIQSQEELHAVIQDAARNEGIVIFTFVSPQLIKSIYSEGLYYAVPTIDVLGPIISRLESLLKHSPMGIPGLLRRTVDAEYYKRISAIDFGVKHDDGAGLATADSADIMLLGVSRSSKTPISVYLSYRGIRAANCPIILDMPLPEPVRRLAPEKLVGLIVDPERLVELRKIRYKNLGNAPRDYIDPAQVHREVEYARGLYAKLRCPVVDVTMKSIEEAATEILRLLRSRGVSLDREPPP